VCDGGVCAKQGLLMCRPAAAVFCWIAARMLCVGCCCYPARPQEGRVVGRVLHCKVLPSVAPGWSVGVGR
jgi:hypothetical protein